MRGVRNLGEIQGSNFSSIAGFGFKGGTSLSKVWRVIQRFSEDIDISLSREWLGFSGERDPEQAKGKQQKRLLAQLSEACAKRLQGEVMPSLRRPMEHKNF